MKDVKKIEKKRQAKFMLREIKRAGRFLIGFRRDFTNNNNNYDFCGQHEEIIWTIKNNIAPVPQSVLENAILSCLHVLLSYSVVLSEKKRQEWEKNLKALAEIEREQYGKGIWYFVNIINFTPYLTWQYINNTYDYIDNGKMPHGYSHHIDHSKIESSPIRLCLKLCSLYKPNRSVHAIEVMIAAGDSLAKSFRPEENMRGVHGLFAFGGFRFITHATWALISKQTKLFALHARNLPFMICLENLRDTKEKYKLGNNAILLALQTVYDREFLPSFLHERARLKNELKFLYAASVTLKFGLKARLPQKFNTIFGEFNLNHTIVASRLNRAVYSKFLKIQLESTNKEEYMLSIKGKREKTWNEFKIKEILEIPRCDPKGLIFSYAMCRPNHLSRDQHTILLEQIIHVLGYEMVPYSKDLRRLSFHAASHQNSFLFSLLLNTGIDLNQRNEYGCTLLMYASFENSMIFHPLSQSARMIQGTQTVKKLHDSINERDNEGKTALMYIGMKRDTKAYHILCSLGASAKMKDQRGNTASDYIDIQAMQCINVGGNLTRSFSKNTKAYLKTKQTCKKVFDNINTFLSSKKENDENEEKELPMIPW